MRWPLLLLALGACTKSEPLLLPEGTPPEGSVLFALREPDEAPRIFAYPTNAVPPLAIAPETELFVLAYPNALAELGLERGAQQRPGDAEPARPFPPGFAAFRSDEERASWTALTADEAEDALGVRVLKAPPECESAGGCIRRREAEKYEYCELPCDAPAEPLMPAAPTPAMIPNFGACPTGWLVRTSNAGDVDYCEPEAIASCPAGSAHFLGDDGCSEVGSSCPADGWPADLPAGRTIRYVRPGASGSGTQASPYGTIAEALAAASATDIIALSTGDHAGSVAVDRSIAIIGACASTSVASVTIAAGSTSELRDLTVRGPLAIQGDTMLDGVVVAGGIDVEGTLSARELVVHDAPNGGLLVTGASASATIERAYFAGNFGFGLRAEEGATVRATDLIVRGTRRSADGAFETLGYGVLGRSSSLTVERALFEDNAANAFAAWYSSTAQGTWIVVRDSLGQYGVDADTDASSVVDKLVVLRSGIGAVWTFRGGAAEITNAYVSASGGGMFARQGGRLKATAVVLEDNGDVAFESSSASSIDVSNAIVRDQADEAFLVDEGSLTGDRIEIDRAARYGIDVRGSATQAAATLSNVRISGLRVGGTLSFFCLSEGSNIRVSGSTRLVLHKALLDGGTRGIGVDSFDAHVFDDVTIENAQRSGLCLSDGTYQVARVRIEDTAGVGVLLDGAYVEATDLAVLRTRTSGSEIYSGDGAFLTGINNIMDVRLASFHVDAILFQDNAERGLHMDNASEAELLNGRVEGSRVGIEVNQPSFDATKLYTNVIFRNNAQNLLVMF